ncbi:MAG: TPM domain-containing protein [Betaproteobacteria bacterium]
MRVLRHLFIPDWLAMRAFPPACLREIEGAITASEKRHRGELRFAVEGSLPLQFLSLTPRQRAEQLFSLLRVWDTAENSGVLIYVQRLDHAIEIVADRGIAAKVPQAEWDAICRAMESAFRGKRYAEGSLEAIRQATALLARHFPAGVQNTDELPNRPVLL